MRSRPSSPARRKVIQSSMLVPMSATAVTRDAEIARAGENKRFLPGFPLPKNLRLQSDERLVALTRRGNHGAFETLDLHKQGFDVVPVIVVRQRIVRPGGRRLAAGPLDGRTAGRGAAAAEPDSSMHSAGHSRRHSSASGSGTKSSSSPAAGLGCSTRKRCRRPRGRRT